MDSILLDTSVASLFHPRRRNSPQRILYEPYLQGRVLTLSFQTVAELYQWAEQNRWGEPARSALEQLISTFAVIPFDVELAKAWARVMTHTRAIGRRLETADAWVAATAVRHSIPLVTQDLDLQRLKVPGLTVICHTP